MPRAKITKTEATEPRIYIKQEELTRGIDVACQTEGAGGDWDDDRMKKYRNMKRKLMELIVKKKEYQATVDKLNRRIQTLEKKTRQPQQKRVVTGKLKNNDDMDICQPEDDGGELTGTMDMEQDEVEEEEEEDEEEDQLDSDDDSAPEPKKQRLTRRKRVLIPRDENGNITLPFQIASLNVISLGKIEYKRSQFHNERYIFPIGYTVERTFMSMVDPNNQTSYKCKVEDGGDGPLFTISAADAPEIELSARTATGVWALVIKKANEVRQKPSSNAISGPEYYGFANPLVVEMMEEMENVDKCIRYKRKNK